MDRRQRFRSIPFALAVTFGLMACTPRVEVAVDKPITVNLNVKIDHEIRVRVDKQLDDLFNDESGLF